ncbi:MAG: DUF6499 domain-containing protein [Novosphingobium sp.]
MSGGSSWRSPKAAERYALHDYADFAQEFLRRNHNYRRDYYATMERIALAPETRLKEQEGLAGRWGLSFPHCSALGSTHTTGTVVAESGTRRRRP